ncbi:MAG: permease-like cell division protein FtsX [Actinomycetaceae bacterium]|nr:permease-like cell division protein FtsX [Actinomycetaceae bacterium]
MRLGFILSQTFKGLLSNKAMAASVALVTFVSLMFVGSAALLQTQIGNLKDQWYDKVEVSAFMCPLNSDSPSCAAGEATEEQIEAIRTYLEGDEMKPYIDTVSFETKAQALENYKKQMEGTAWVEALTEDQMQVSFRIKLVDPEQYQIVADALSGRPGVEVVNDQRKQLEPLFNVLNKLTIVASALAIVMIATALMLMPTTIRLSAMSRKNETEIMRYVGASNLFIELPFILEGVLAALVGALLAVVGLWAVIRFLVQDWFASSMQWMNIVNVGDLRLLAPLLVVGAVVVASFASWLALRRYAKV